MLELTALEIQAQLHLVVLVEDRLTSELEQAQHLAKEIRVETDLCSSHLDLTMVVEAAVLGQLVAADQPLRQ